MNEHDFSDSLNKNVNIMSAGVGACCFTTECLCVEPPQSCLSRWVGICLSSSSVERVYFYKKYCYNKHLYHIYIKSTKIAPKIVLLVASKLRKATIMKHNPQNVPDCWPRGAWKSHSKALRSLVLSAVGRFCIIFLMINEMQKPSTNTID